MTAEYRCEPLGKDYSRAAFSCGNDELDRYFRERATQDEKRHVARSYTMVEIATGIVAGYYTIAATSVDLSALPPDLARTLPRYPAAPAILLGRLARDLRFRGRGVGELLLANALQLCHRIADELGALGIVVDAIDEAARTFCERHEFSRFPEQPYRLFFPFATIGKLIEPRGEQ
jgi:GNAT superfamily N-acetyltransferase